MRNMSQPNVKNYQDRSDIFQKSFSKMNNETDASRAPQRVAGKSLKQSQEQQNTSNDYADYRDAQV